MAKRAKVSTAERLTRELTAFFSFGEFLGCLRRGYCPTLRPTRAGHKLARIVRGHGYPVFMGGRVW